MRRISVRKAVATAVVGLAATAALTACGPGGQDQGSASNSGGSSSQGTSGTDASKSSGSNNSNAGSGSSSTGSNSGGSTRGSGGSNNSPSGSSGNGADCRTSNLQITAKNRGEQGPNNLGEITITFRNTGSDCRMAGFPGVDMKTNYGTQSVDRNKQERGVPYTLKSGRTGSASVVYTVNKTGGSGVQGSALVVTPPNETHSVTVPVGFNLPVTDKTDKTIQVTPVFEDH